MKKCKKCGKEIANNARICKYCNFEIVKKPVAATSNKKVATNKKVEVVKALPKPKKSPVSKPVLVQEKKIQEPVIKSKLLIIKDKGITIIKSIKEKIVKLNKKIDKETKIRKTDNKFIIIFKKNIKKVIILFIIAILLFLGIFFGTKLYYKITNHDNTIIVGMKNRKTNFKIGDKITYKKINYKIKSIEKSSGNSYSKPKDGNEFIIVTIELENNSNEKYTYSYNNWKMINSLGEEKNRVVTTLNLGKSLNLGTLVVGGTKTGTLVFEQPKDDKCLSLRFYEINKQQISKMIFTIKL